MADVTGIRPDVDYAGLMEKHDGNKARASRDTDLSPATFSRHVMKLGLCEPTTHTGEAQIAIPLTGGIDLNNVRTATKKPMDCVRDRLYTLPKGKGFPLDEAAKEWSVSSATLKKHARDIGAFVYAEISPGDWREFVKYPTKS